MNNWKLKLRLFLTPILLFGLLYILLMIIGSFLGIARYELMVLIGLVVIFIQYLLGPKIVESTMNVKYLSRTEAPELHRIIEELSVSAGIPKPKVAISNIDIPNAFAFGRTKKDGRVCVTQGLLNLLDIDELRAVLGHEISHIKHNDMIVMTFISAVPLICYYIALSTLFSRNDNSAIYAVGFLAFIFYLLGQLLVLFISRVREYYADEGSVNMGSRPEHLASALYKLVYGSATANEDEVKSIEGVKAFFANDISSAGKEIESLSALDLDKNGAISYDELSNLRNRKTNISTSDKFMELLSTHPNMLKRIKRLSELENN